MDASLLAHPIALPPSGKSWSFGTHFVTVATIGDMRRLFGPEDDAVRRRKSEFFYEGISPRRRLPQGMHDRGEEYIVADGKVHECDRIGLRNHFPAHVKIIRLADRHLAKNEVWDISVRHSQWPGLDYMEELYVFLHVDRLVLEENARLIVRGNVLFARFDRLERASDRADHRPADADCCDIGILPTPFSVDRQLSPNTGRHGRDGEAGMNGRAGEPPIIAGSLFGPRLRAPAARPDGGDGEAGQPGEDGVRGRNGGMCKLADLRIGRLINFANNPLRVFAQAGPGGIGGNGGTGGNGGDGGNGAAGVVCVEQELAPGRGGDGGNGGGGGNGGNGGNGGLSSNIFVQVPEGDQACVRTCSLPSQGGIGGRGGEGGKAGAGGLGGSMRPVPESSSAAARFGADGQAAETGRDGLPGKPRAGARIFILPGAT